MIIFYSDLVDGLLVVGYTLSEDLVLYILGGLSSELEVVVVSLTSRGSLPSHFEVQSILHTHKVRLLQHSAVITVAPLQPSTLNPNVNLTYKDSKNSNSRSGKTKGKPRFQNKNKIICQLCGKANHVAIKCFKRFDVNFHGLEPPVATQSPQANLVHQQSSLLPTPSTYHTMSMIMFHLHRIQVVDGLLTVELHIM